MKLSSKQTGLDCSLNFFVTHICPFNFPLSRQLLSVAVVVRDIIQYVSETGQRWKQADGEAGKQLEDKTKIASALL